MVRLIILLLFPLNLLAQGSFSPQAGESGSDAIPKDSSCFRDWAIACEVSRGYKQINVPDSGYVSTGNALYAIGKADAPLIVTLGDSGVATLMFSASIYNGEGPDFAVFENGFGFGAEAYLELAFVEASSDGYTFFRFPAQTEWDASVQIDPYGNSDASYFHNLAGKYISGYGVPFDIAELPDTSALDKNNITHVRIVDVIGTIDSNYASRDVNGNIINDPWPTRFDAGGFDLDAVGVIHSNIPLAIRDIHEGELKGLQSTVDILGRNVGASTFQVYFDENGVKQLGVFENNK